MFIKFTKLSVLVALYNLRILQNYCEHTRLSKKDIGQAKRSPQGDRQWWVGRFTTLFRVLVCNVCKSGPVCDVGATEFLKNCSRSCADAHWARLCDRVYVLRRFHRKISLSFAVNHWGWVFRRRSIVRSCHVRGQFDKVPDSREALSGVFEFTGIDKILGVLVVAQPQFD